MTDSIYNDHARCAWCGELFPIDKLSRKSMCKKCVAALAQQDDTEIVYTKPAGTRTKGDSNAS